MFVIDVFVYYRMPYEYVLGLKKTYDNMSDLKI